MNRRVHIVVSGKVQGVSFRSNIKKLADSLIVHGTVKNIDIDKIEAIFEGEPIAVNKLVEFCKEGPDEAEVLAIIIDEEDYKGEFKNFSITE